MLAALPSAILAYEAAIAAAGGIDFQILGIGKTGHIGFNEPGSGADSRTRLVTLDAVTRKDAAAMTHIPDLMNLARHPNVAVKATGAPGYASDTYPYAGAQTYLRQVFDAFGPSRMFWGTDISKMPCSWKQCVTMFTEELPWLRGRDLELVMGGGLCAWWGWERRPNA